MLFSRLTSAVTRHPWLVIAVWVVAAFGLSSAGALKAADVTTDDQASFLPGMINKEGQTELLPRTDKRSDEVCEYVEWACRDQDLKTNFHRRGDEVVVSLDS